MRRRVQAFGALLILLAACVAACSTSRPRATSPTTTSGPDTAAAPNPDVIPPVITPAYVNAIFAVLNHVNGNAARELIQVGALTNTVSNALGAIYSPPLYGVELKVFQLGLTQDRSNLRSPVGDRVTTVRSMISASPKCIFVETVSNLSAVELHPSAPPANEYWELQPKGLDQDPGGLNPTPWSLSFNQDYSTPTTISDPCSAG